MTKTVHVPGISCGHCVMTIEKELDDLDGVEDVKAEHASKQVTVSWILRLWIGQSLRTL